MNIGRTGQTNSVSGIYRDTCHGHERAIPQGHTFPPCSGCQKAVTWVLVRRTDTDGRR